MSPASSSGSSSSMLASTTPAGTISHTRARFRELGDEVLQRGRAGDAVRRLRERLHRCACAVEDHTLVAAGDEPLHHVRSHPAQADHSQLHRALRSRVKDRAMVVRRGADVMLRVTLCTPCVPGPLTHGMFKLTEAHDA